MSDCPFCDRVLAGEYDESDQYCASFEPLNPVTPGHLLVIPKTHVSDATIDPELTGWVMQFAAILARERESSNLITSVGGWASQTVKHLYVHIVPRRPNDGLMLPWGQVEKCGYCYCPLNEAPECADGCAHRDLQGHVGCGLRIAPAETVPRQATRRPTRGQVRASHG